MSHYTVLVIGEDPEDQLAPYDESIEMPPYHVGPVPTDEIESFVDHYKGKYPPKTKFKIAVGADIKVEEEDVTFEKMYEKHGKTWNGKRWRKHTDGTWHNYSTYNPQSKWDWYSLGGRWTGFFKVKPGSKAELGQPGVFGNKPPEGTADQLMKKDIDFDTMYSEAADRAAKEWSKIMTPEVLALPEPISWDSFADKMKAIDEDMKLNYTADDYHKEYRKRVEPLRNEYWAQPKIAKMKENAGEDRFFFEPSDYLGMTRDEFVGLAMASCIAPFALVKDGQWQEKGQMGWFGMASNEKDQKDWNKEVYDLINSLPEDTLLSLYDCHI